MMRVIWLAVFGLVVLAGSLASGEDRPPGIRDDPAAHALYDGMVAAMREAKTLSWVSEYRQGTKEAGEFGKARYGIWLKKPNFARLEATRDEKTRGVLIGDGNTFWIYWPLGRPQYGWEYEGERAKTYERTKFISYIRKRAPQGGHSIGHETSSLGAGLGMTILDPSTFHGYTDSLQKYLDGVVALPDEKLGETDCRVIEVHFMKSQRIWRLWIAKSDSLPRKLYQEVRVRRTYWTEEIWSEVTVGEEIPNEWFEWAPPKGWLRWVKPGISEGLLEPGTTAPAFDLPIHEGGRASLAALTGKVVWFYIWRAG